MYECDQCGKQFSDIRGAYLGRVCPPMYDRIVVCAECCKKNKEIKAHEEDRRKANIKKLESLNTSVGLGAVVGVYFDKDHNFDDIFVLGIANSESDANALIMADIKRLSREFTPNHVDVTTGKSEYEHSITCVKYGAGYASYYYEVPGLLEVLS